MLVPTLLSNFNLRHFRSVFGEQATAIAARLEVGTAWVNQHRATSATVPFGGAKESGMGRQYSILGLKENMEAQVISVLKQPI